MFLMVDAGANGRISAVEFEAARAEELAAVEASSDAKFAAEDAAAMCRD